MVEEAAEVRPLGEGLSLTLKVMVFRSLPAGAEITTFFAPALM